MLPRLARPAAVVTACLVLAGCGGEEKTYDFEAVESCLRDNAGAGVSTNSEDLDLISEAAGIGGIQVRVGKNEAQVAVERAEADAKNTERLYEAFGVPEMKREGNVVVAWTKTPTDAEREAVEGCLE